MKTQGDEKQQRGNEAQEDLVQDQAILDLTRAIADRERVRANVEQEHLDRQRAQFEVLSETGQDLTPSTPQDVCGAQTR